jgi:hypothetical protein
MSTALERLSVEELEAEAGAILPAKEVMSVPLLDLNADINLALDLAAPIDLAVAGNANVALPINAGVSANALSVLSDAEAGSSQQVGLDQFVSGHAIAHGAQTSNVDQSGTGDSAAPAPHVPVPGDSTQPVPPAAQPDSAGAPAAADASQPADPTSADTPSLDNGLLNVNVNVDLNSKLAAPITGAVALNANAAAPVNGSVAANVGTIGSSAIAVSDQTALISQQMQDVTAEATTDQNADVNQ